MTLLRAIAAILLLLLAVGVALVGAGKPLPLGKNRRLCLTLGINGRELPPTFFYALALCFFGASLVIALA